MNDAGMILAAMAGFLLGILGGLLFLAGKNRQMAELKGAIRGCEEEYS